MRNRSRQLINLILVALLSVGLLAGMESVVSMREQGFEHEQMVRDFQSLIRADSYIPLAVDDTYPSHLSIDSVYRADDTAGEVLGHLVTVRVAGYADDLLVRVAVGPDAKTIEGLRVLEHTEPETYGGQAALPFFHTRFEGRAVPLYLTGEQPPPEPVPRALRDGDYTARADSLDPDNGYRYSFRMTVSGGRIQDAMWDGDGGAEEKSLRQASEDGTYVMEVGELPWHEQAIALESLLLRVQDPAFIEVSSDGTVRDAAGITMPVDVLLVLAEDCTQRAAIPSLLGGSMTDGAYRMVSEVPLATTDAYEFVEILVENGRIVSLVWDAEQEDGTLLSQSDASGPVPEDSLPWAEQTALTAAYLLDLQDPTVVQTREDGTTDEIEGVVIPVDTCLSLTRACMLEAGKFPVSAPTPPPPDLSGLVDAIAGATYTSRSVVKAANLAAAYVSWIESDAPTPTP